MSLHSANMSKWVAIALTIGIGFFFAFLAGWTLFDVFATWGNVPALIIGLTTGIVFLLLHMYVFILREYAVDAIEFFSDRRYEEARKRIRWGMFLVVAVILVESTFNADRMIVLQLPNITAKWFIWIGLQVLVFVPFALGKVVHAHINASRTSESRVSSFVDSVDSEYYKRMKGSLKQMTPSQLAQLHAGHTQPIADQLSPPPPNVKPIHPLVKKLHDPAQAWGEGAIVDPRMNGSSQRGNLQ